MQSNSYNILFSGQTLESFALDVAKSNLKKLLKTNDEIIDRLFSGKSIVLKKDLNRQQVDKYISVLNKAGLVVHTEPPITDEFNFDLEESGLEPKEPVVTHSRTTENPTPRVDNPYSAPATQDLLPMVHCRQCGSKINASDAVCSNCGARQSIGKPRSKVTAGLLAIFLGWLGAHRFYLGQWWGIFYFLFGVLIWPIAIIEGIVFLVTSQDKWDKKYGDVKGLGGVLVLVVGVIVFIAIIGILAAIAIPQYQDYTIRAKVHEAMPTIDETRERIEDYVFKNNILPNSNQEVGLPEELTGKNLQTIMIQPGGRMEVTFESEKLNLDERTILWIPEVNNGEVIWDCSGGSLSKRHRPSQCRTGEYQAEQVQSNTQRIESDNGLVEMTVPQSWKRQELSEDAIIQLGNLYAEAYLIVIAESKLELTGYDLKSFADAVLENMSSSLLNSEIRHISNSSVNGLSAIQYRVAGNVDDVDIVYLVTIVEGKEHFHQLLAWSLASRISGNEDDFNYAIRSFRERQADN